MRNFTPKDAKAAARRFLVDSDGRRYRSIHARSVKEDRAVFLRDNEKRVGSARPQARQLWRMITNFQGSTELDRLALAEPFAQRNCSLDEVYQQLLKENASGRIVSLWRRTSGREGITDTAGWGEAEIRAQIVTTRDSLGWDDITDSARKWWEAFERENAHRPVPVLRLLEELKLRKATIKEFYLAYVYSNVDSIPAILHYLDYTRIKKQSEKESREEGSGGGSQGLKRITSNLWPIQSGVSDTTDWTSEQIKQKIDEVRRVIDFANVTENARIMWEAFEKNNEHSPATVLRLMEELKLRKATIAEFHLAYRYANTQNPQAVMCYLDYTRLKREEEEKKRGAAQGSGMKVR